MSQPRDALDLRRATEGVLLDALEVRHPLSLAEAYHRTVPAAHAVARRLMSSADDIEDLLLAAYTQLWESPPTAGPLEGWMRRTVWTLGVDRLRAAGAAPASPSLAGLVPDLPAPDVRFLDAAERAIAELPDEERRALLLAHDKGVPTSAQEPGAAQALARALSALAGPETSAADRAALDEDGCQDVDAMGDWCLGLATSREEAEVDEAIETRPGCAAVSRAARRGRRRVEGLPATPDMGQRVLVQVLTGAAGLAAPAAPADDAAQQDPAQDDAAQGDTAQDDAAWAPPAAVAVEDTDLPRGDTAADPFAALDETGPLTPVDAQTDPLVDAQTDPFAAPGAEDPFAPSVDADPFAPDADADPFAPDADDPFAPDDDADPYAPGADDPFASLDDDAATVTDDLDAVTATDDLQAVTETGDLPASGAEVPAAADEDWRPDPGSTAEMRLSDILAEGDDDDDPFAGLDDDEPGSGQGDPYQALRGLDADGEPTAVRDETLVAPVGVDADADLVGGYVEGQEAPEPVGVGGPSRMAAVLAWILPILGGSAIGILIAITVFGPPS